MKRILPLAGMGLLLLLISCQPRNHVTLKDTNIGDTLDIFQNLVFDFSHDLAPDSLTGKWDSTAYLKLEPAVKGMFKWNSPRQLVFSPAAGFRPATLYTVHINNSVLNYAGGLLRLNTPDLQFRTGDLQLRGFQLWWTLSPGSGDALTLNAALSFNYEVDPSLLGKHLSAELNGKAIALKAGEQSSSTTLMTRAEGLSRADAVSGEFTVRIERGLKCMECTGPAEAMTWKEAIHPITSLEITHTETGFEGGEGVIRIYTNQPIASESTSGSIHLDPAVSYRVESMESGILLRGDFTEGYSYDLSIQPAISGVLGGQLKSVYNCNITFGEQEPGIAFVNSKGMYLTSKGSRKIAVEIINIPHIKVAVYKIYENNILAFMQNNRYEDWMGDDNGYQFTYTDYDPERYGTRIMDQSYSVKDLPRQEGHSLLSLDFEDELPFKGIYLISVRSSDKHWIKATRLVSVSDIGIIARTGSDQVMVFTNSVKDASPLQHIPVSIISSNNQVLFKGRTNADGVVKFTGLKNHFRAFSTALITAGSAGDYNYMLLSDTRVETSRFETGGYKDNINGYMAYLYGDREIYRPGEKVYFNAIVRDRAWKAMKNMPVKFRLLLPNGRELSVMGSTLNSQGAAERFAELPSGTVTGTYTLELYTANDVLLASKAIYVEEFMPDRISVKAQTNKAAYITGDSVTLIARANNLFGSPAAGRNYEIQFNLSKVPFLPVGFEQYNFGIRGIEKVNFPPVLKQGKTNSNGDIRESIYLDHVYRGTGKLQGKAFVTVFDETGRPVNRVASYDVETQSIYFGTRCSEYYAGIGQSLQLGIIALNPQGKTISATAQVRIVKINYHNVLQRDYGGRLYYISQKEEKIIQDRQVSIGAQELIVPFTPGESGEYVMRVSLPGTEKFTEEEFYAYGRGFTGSNSFAVNTDGVIDISSDKKSYAPGDNARLLFKAPFNGRLLVTVEQNEVIQYYYLNTDKKTAELVIPVKKEYLPNVYITATLFRKSDEGTIPLTVAHGVVPLMVEDHNNRLPLSISASPVSRSNTRQRISVKTKAGREVELTLAVVDEGILQLHDTKTPDPYPYFYQKKSLAVGAYDIYPYLLPDLKLRRSSSGGDGYDLAKRVNPVTSKRVKLVSCWSGHLRTNAAGQASFDVDIPAFSGDLRVMAVAYSDHAFGNAEAHIKVADPVVISSALPRFTSPGDTVIVPVTLTNTTRQTIVAGIRAETTGAIKSAAASENNISIRAGDEKRILYKVIAGNQGGEGSFTITVKNGNESYREKTEITVRPATGLQKRNGYGSLKGNESIEISLESGFIPASESSELIISKSPLVSFADHMKYLLDYPHGCAEQIISTSFPQLYFADLAKTISNKPGHTIHVQENVQAGINKIVSLQHYQGGIVTWPGNSSGNRWTSAYAAHFLTEARKAGYSVPENAFEKLISYLQKNVKEKNTEEVWYYDASNTLYNRKLAAKDIFYSLYVLALNNRADRSTMNYYKSSFHNLAIDSKYLLAFTYLATGDRKTYASLLPKEFKGEKSVQSTGGSYYSYIRDMAMALNAMLSFDPDHPQAGLLARNLSKEMSGKNFLNTQERAFSFLALGKFSKQAAGSDISAEISSGDGKKHLFTGKDLVIRKGIAGNKIRISTRGKGNVYYFWSSEGLRADNSYLQEDQLLKVRKTFMNRSGQEIKNNSFNQNDLIIVKITLENTSRSFVENVVISDLLPAGFEIENPRVSALPDLDWIKDNSASEHIDLRDDRINIYTGIGQQAQNYYYVVRAVSPGSYVMGPVSADAMYSGEYHSMHGAGRITVK